MNIIPLYMTRAAVRLDPSKPSYSMRMIGLYEEKGEQAAADALRRELVARLGPSISLLEEEGMVFSGKAPKQPIMQIIELPKHKFYMGTQYHPEFTSRPLKPDPLFLNFVKAAKGK